MSDNLSAVGVLGTGVVGETIAARLAELGHDVLIGSRTAKSDRVVTFADAAAHGHLLVNATGGLVSIDALTAANTAGALDGKVLIDVSNPLDFSEGFPPKVLATDRESCSERIQAAFPQARVVKALNTMNMALGVNPRSLPATHSTFIAGNDDDAKADVRALLRTLGWGDEEILDLGDLTGARGLELYLTLWLRLMGTVGGPTFNIHVVRD
jgi:predicted dinucleotide-binding enzyme